MFSSSVIAGIGAYLPKKILTNDDLSKIVDTNDEWISTRTGIKQRHIAAEDETTSRLAAEAAKAALLDANLSIDDIDQIIVATTTPERIFPATAVLTQELLEMHHGSAFDVQAVCAGFVYAISLADSQIKTGQAKRILVIGAEKMSSILDWNDRSTCVLFGDGAGAIILEASDDKHCGILASKIYSDGRHHDILYADKAEGTIMMAGQDVFKHAVSKMYHATGVVLEEAGLTADDVDYLVPHQANQRIIDSVAKKMKLPAKRIVSTVALHANTSAASIPLALVTGKKDGRLKKGDILALSAIGGGLAWGSCIIKL